MSGQQPPYGPPPQQPGGQPPYGRPQPGGQPPYPYGPPPQGPPQGPPPQGPPQGPPGGWQQPPGPGRQPGTSRSRPTVLIAALGALALVFALLSGYLWFFDSDPGSAPDASMEEVSLPTELGDYTEQDPDSAGDYAVDLEQTRADYEEVTGAGFDTKTYVPSGESGDARTITVQAIRADIPLTPYNTTKTSSTEIVRDDLLCSLAYYEGYDSDAKSDDDGEKEQLPQTCFRSGDGMTVYVSTYSTSTDKDAPTLDEMVELTDEAYDAAID